ncbi:hypothetical protein A3A03_03080 [Candidatus Nomurabacteria bacterium RIFCSPLOWO2_01_FULL_40_18]|uniref:Steroid 5-alpha reductase C-terminal domain-containing protein n=1 Tax=Candidatus Nomurabacteria bacterium RIFCSPLOWO2_01_FULL_40_18 TaxID=1801773 RepID=A0A1F6XKQ6_9BACT|nr:MAG: hypothetical protein A3A03_03080 [Candidatus Nomurabacteria bacterium RIFCSPLOWO2_01_FULL_40_18]
MGTESKVENNNPHKNRVHRILAHSYTLYFILFLIGVTLDIIFQFKIFTTIIAVPFGLLLIIFASCLILWAQISSRRMKKENISKETFSQGPYHYSKHPTHWGLFFLTLGFGIMANALFVILTTLISFLLSRHTFLEKHEDVLSRKYGAPYIEYKKSVKL